MSHVPLPHMFICPHAFGRVVSVKRTHGPSVSHSVLTWSKLLNGDTFKWDAPGAVERPGVYTQRENLLVFL